MKRAAFLPLPILLLLAFAPSPNLPGEAPSPLPEVIAIQVSPQTLILDWKTQGDPRVTVHADVDFSLFAGGSLEIWLGEVQATYIKSDARGDLVAKFPFEEVVESLGLGPVTLTLNAYDNNGDFYTGSDEVRIINP